jgi:hypothetical protein
MKMQKKGNRTSRIKVVKELGLDDIEKVLKELKEKLTGTCHAILKAADVKK